MVVCHLQVTSSSQRKNYHIQVKIKTIWIKSLTHQKLALNFSEIFDLYAAMDIGTRMSTVELEASFVVKGFTILPS
ncbi:hypothetical protein KFK09_005094 [Dendrobium nobile]|uniref:Uncharacterized protein n=1 Tax=Dendrobium nobile TaxID=94219 RepID=A0A8T3BZW6_DENNO|nr:hypothetical protein KFK09_005094 [Dendrobium nobile]